MGRSDSDPAPGGTAPPETKAASVVGAALPQPEYEAIYSRVPRLTVELVIVSSDQVLLTRRQTGACAGLWHIPGGTVRFGEPLTDAIDRVAFQELGVEVLNDGLLGYIEYPSHLEQGLDWPVGIVFGLHMAPSPAGRLHGEDDRVAWFTTLPDDMHDEQKDFLRARGLVS